MNKLSAYELAAEINLMNTGDRRLISRELIREVQGNFLVGQSGWDRVLENVVGSAWEFKFHQDPMTGDVEIERFEGDGKRRFVDHDRRHLFTEEAGGILVPKEPHDHV